MEAKRLYKGQPGTSAGVLYTSPADGGGTIIKAVRAVNTDASARWLKLGTSGTADADLLLPDWAIDPDGLLQDDSLIILEPGQTINGQAEVASKITVHLFGMEL